MKLFNVLALVVAITTCRIQAGEWRLVGEVQLGDGAWVPIESQSDTVDTRTASGPQLLVPGRPGSTSVPGPASLGGKANGPGWTYHVAIKEFQFVPTFGQLKFAVAEDYTVAQYAVWESSAKTYSLQADFTNRCYYVTLERNSLAPSSGAPMRVRFTILRHVPAPELIMAEDAYNYSVTESFNLGFLPVPLIGKVYLQTKEGTNDWTNFSVIGTWFERGNSIVVFGPTSGRWTDPTLSKRSPVRLFRLHQVPFDPISHTNVTHEIEVAGVQTQMDYLTFGEDCRTLIARPRWVVPSGSGQIELGVRFSNGKLSMTKIMGSSPFIVSDIQRWSVGASNWVIYAKRP